MGRIRVSIIILTKNAEKTIKKCLDSVYRQAYKNFEVIVIDSGSTDKTLKIVGEYPVRLFKIKPEEFNHGKTRDLGAELAKGEYLVYLTQDAIPINEHWLSNLVAPFKEKEVAAVQGGKLCKPRKFYWMRPWLNIENMFYFTRETRKWLKKYKIGFSNVNSAIRKDVWKKCRFGEVMLAEDKVFQKKLVESGYKIKFTENADVNHSHGYDLKTLRKRLLFEGYGFKFAGVDYNFFDLMIDLLIALTMYLSLAIPLYLRIIRNVIKLEKPSLSELAFPILRPVLVYKGNHMKYEKGI